MRKKSMKGEGTNPSPINSTGSGARALLVVYWNSIKFYLLWKLKLWNSHTHIKPLISMPRETASHLPPALPSHTHQKKKATGAAFPPAQKKQKSFVYNFLIWYS